MSQWSNTSTGQPSFVSKMAGYDPANVFANKEGWVYRHRGANGRYWDEVLVAWGDLSGYISPTVYSVYFEKNTTKSANIVFAGSTSNVLFNVDDVVWQANATANIAVGTVTSSTVNPLSVLVISSLNGTFEADDTVLQNDGVANVAIGTVFFANSSQVWVDVASGTFTTEYTVYVYEAETTNAAVDSINFQAEGQVTLNVTEGNFVNTTLLLSSSGNATPTTANSVAVANVVVGFTEPVVTTGTPQINVGASVSTAVTANLVAGNNSPFLTFTLEADPGQVFTLSSDQVLALNSGTIKDAGNTSINANLVFANSVIRPVGLSGSNTQIEIT